MTGRGRVSVILVGGHESAHGNDLSRLPTLLGEDTATTPAGRALGELVERAAEAGTVIVVPMTFGRDPAMVANAARTLKWLAPRYPGRIAISRPFGQPDHLTAWLRAAANRAAGGDGDPALLIVAPHSNPFDEAELHRLAYLVATYGAIREVHVAIADDAAGLEAAAQRVRRLGPTRVVAVPAGFAETLPPAGVEFAGPLMGDAAIAGVVRTRVREAVAALTAGRDGIDDALLADHDHGYAHSHAFSDGQEHTHPHSHPHTHADGTTHTHGHDGPHAHFAPTAADNGHTEPHP